MSTTMDMISYLPDDILLHILSFLPTRTSIATSLLSRRWRHLWKGVEVLDIEDLSFCFPSVSDHDARKRFFAFANGVLSCHKAHRVLKFRLSGMVFSWKAVDHLVESTIKPHLEDLCLSLNSSLQINRRLFCCISIFTCSSLVSLVLEGTLALHNYLSIVNLPSLKNLKLNVHSVDLEKILSGCPVLETLNVSSRRIFSAVIHLPRSLKSFKFEFIGEFKHPYYGGCAINSIEIDTPSLEYLQIILHHCRVRNLVCNLPKVVEAHLYICVEDLHVCWLPKLLRALCTTKLLVLGDSTVVCLLRAPTSPFPDFHCLFQLQIDFISRPFSSTFLIALLRCSPKLQGLIIHCSHCPQPSQPSGWKQPISVPHCVTSHLKTFEFKHGNYPEESAFARYILQHSNLCRCHDI
ncbi:hypothetical protein PIB30_060797 [Stylosanthes scabra]|uniref:F-box domain-containing protein n=1 Tax=Stylosanthes scabra TaxID=79078 RepID=A0ABU6WLU8_9FABA|nr:hypothetical protein [Stylosanthes scabra]